MQNHTSETRCRENSPAPAQTLQAWTPQSEMAANGQQGAAGIEPTLQKNKASQAVAEGGGVGFIENAGGDDEPGGGGSDCSSQRVLIPYETQAEWDALSPRVREQRGRDWDTAMLLLGVRGGNGGAGGNPIRFDASGCRVYEADGRQAEMEADGQQGAAEMAADGQQGAAGIEPTIQKNKASQAVAEGNHCIRKVKTVRQLRAGESANDSRWSLCTSRQLRAGESGRRGCWRSLQRAVCAGTGRS